MMIVRGNKRTTRGQEDNETTTTGVATTMVCHRMCDNHYYCLEEEERLTTMRGDRQAQGDLCHYDTTTRKTAMITIMQDLLQERSNKKRTMTSLEYIIRLTDKLRLLLLVFFTRTGACG